MKNIREAAERCLATPSAFAGPIGDAMAALAELQRIAAVQGHALAEIERQARRHLMLNDVLEARLELLDARLNEIRAERHRLDAALAQMQSEVARFRNAADALEAMLEARNVGGQSEPRKCECPPGGLSVVLCGGYCAKCGGKA